VTDHDTDDTLEDLPLDALPLDTWHRAKGARMVPFAGYEMPIQYTGEFGGIVAEHNWTRENAGLFDVSHMGQLLLSGPDLDAAVEAVLPIDLSTLKLGQQRYSLLLDEHGGVLDDLMVSRWPDALYLVVNGATKWDDIGTLREALPDDITLPLLWAGLLVNIWGVFAPLQEAVIGAAAGYLSLWTVYWVFKLVTGKEGMGYGDFKLLAAIGAWIGWQALPLVILLSSLAGAVIGIGLIAAARMGRSVPMPFGPYLVIAGVIALVWGDGIIAGYLKLMG
jgi:Flp pilus assembly protein protease CpaA